MDYTHLGRTGLSVSRLCLGTMNFGPVTDVTDSHDIMDRAHELGINFFDSANVYGWGENKGLTENIVGNWFARGGGRRDKTVLATKLYGDMGEWPNDGKLSALNIRRACDASLKRLQTDYIDLYQMHHVDRDAPWDEIWEGYETLRAQGKIIYAGSSNFAGWHIAKAQEAAKRRNYLGLVAEQSLNNRSKSGRANDTLEANRPAVEAYEAFCDELGEDPANVALAWLLHQPAVTAPIIGPRTLAQLDGVVRAIEIKLDDKALARLDEIWPGPGGQAPEAYSW